MFLGFIITDSNQDSTTKFPSWRINFMLYNIWTTTSFNRILGHLLHSHRLHFFSFSILFILTILSCGIKMISNLCFLSLFFPPLSSLTPFSFFFHLLFSSRFLQSFLFIQSSHVYLPYRNCPEKGSYCSCTFISILLPQTHV